MTTAHTPPRNTRHDRTWRPLSAALLAGANVEPVPAPAAILVLAGGLRPSPLSAECGRSVLDLPLATDQTVLMCWLNRFAELGGRDRSRLEVRIIHNQHTPAPAIPFPPASIEVLIERESRDYRGPAGVAKDACERYDPEATIIVVEGARCVTCAISGLVREHAVSGAAITVGCNPDRSPAGVYAVRRSSLDLVPGGGFMDLKEQWLSRVVASGASVRVHVLANGLSIPLRTLDQYIAAVGEVNGWRASSVHQDESPDMCDRARTSHTVLTPGATVGDGAVLIDSVVMGGTTIGRGAIVARSLVCEGAVVPAGAEIVGSVVTGRGATRMLVRPRGTSKAKP